MTAPQQWQGLTLAQYVDRRNGVPYLIVVCLVVTLLVRQLFAIP